MNSVNPGDYSPIDRDFYIRKYGLENSLPLKSREDAEVERLENIKQVRAEECTPLSIFR